MMNTPRAALLHFAILLAWVSPSLGVPLASLSIDRQFPTFWCPIETRNGNLLQFTALSDAVIVTCESTESTDRLDNIMVIEAGAYAPPNSGPVPGMFESCYAGAEFAPAYYFLPTDIGAGVVYSELFDTPDLPAWTGGTWDGTSSAPRLVQPGSTADSGVGGSLQIGDGARLRVEGLTPGQDYVVVGWWESIDELITLSIQVDDFAPFLQYRFDEGPLGSQPTLLVDDAAGNDGTYGGAPIYTEGDPRCPQDLALDFDPGDGIDLVETSTPLPDLSTLLGDLTVEALVKVRNPTVGTPYLVSNRPLAGGLQFALWIDAGHLTATFGDGVAGHVDQVVDPAVVMPGTWYRVAAVRDEFGGEVQLYVDGAPVDAHPLQYGLALNNLSFGIGAWAGSLLPSLGFDGALSEVRLTSIALRDDELLDCVATSVVSSPASNTLALTVVPNPTSSRASFVYRMGRSGPGLLEVFDVRGRRVASFGVDPSRAGTKLWDGRDRFGREVGGGVFFVRLTSGKESITRKLIVLR